MLVLSRPFVPPRAASRPRRLAGHGLVALLALASAAASAQTSVTIYGGARGGGDLIDDNAGGESIRLDSGGAAAISFDWALADGRQAQIFYSGQRSSLPGSAFGRTGEVAVDVSYLHLGGRTYFDGTRDGGGAYAVGGLGITNLSPGLGGYSSEVLPSLNLGVGFAWPLGRQVMLRGELRGYVTLVNSSGSLFCSGGCVISIRGDTMMQAEGLLGLSVGF